jgi:uncharacterized protein
MNAKTIFLVIALCLVACSVSAAPTEYPHLTKYVNDFAGILSPDTITYLDQQCAAIERNTSYEIAIVTVPNTNGENVIMYAAKMSDISGVGKADTDNGITVMFSQDNVAGVAIATGRGSEYILPDAKSFYILKHHEAEFDNMDYNQGFKGIVSDIEQVLIEKSDENPIPKIQPPTTKQSGMGSIVVVTFIVSGILIAMQMRK